MTFDQRMIIDATKGSVARFVNHSCEPNCKMEKRTVAGAPRMALFAGDNGVMTGEELTYDYNFEFVLFSIRVSEYVLLTNTQPIFPEERTAMPLWHPVLPWRSWTSAKGL